MGFPLRMPWPLRMTSLQIWCLFAKSSKVMSFVCKKSSEEEVYLRSKYLDFMLRLSRAVGEGGRSRKGSNESILNNF